MNNGYLTTHVLDISIGRPASAIHIKLLDEDEQIVHETKTNNDGRTDAPILSGTAFKKGKYSLIFSVKDYLIAKHQPVDEPFYNQIRIEFVISDSGDHYHVPLLLSPYGYSTYRGS